MLAGHEVGSLGLGAGEATRLGVWAYSTTGIGYSSPTGSSLHAFRMVTGSNPKASQLPRQAHAQHARGLPGAPTVHPRPCSPPHLGCPRPCLQRYPIIDVRGRGLMLAAEFGRRQPDGSLRADPGTASKLTHAAGRRGLLLLGAGACAAVGLGGF